MENILWYLEQQERAAQPYESIDNDTIKRDLAILFDSIGA
jgi:hypothetical protein